MEWGYMGEINKQINNGGKKCYDHRYIFRILQKYAAF